MSGPELKRLQKARRSVVISLSLALLVVSAGLAFRAYPWDALIVHGVSLTSMLLAISPVAALMTVTLLFLWDMGRETASLDRAEQDRGREQASESADLRAVTERALAMIPWAAERVRVEWPAGPLRTDLDASRAQLGIVGLLASAVNGPEERARLVGEVGPDGGPRLRLRAPAHAADRLRTALDLMDRLGVEVKLSSDAADVEAVMDFSPCREDA